MTLIAISEFHNKHTNNDASTRACHYRSRVFALDIANESEAIRCPVASRRARFVMQDILFRAHMAQAEDDDIV